VRPWYLDLCWPPHLSKNLLPQSGTQQTG